jgi:oxygen-independent coproporphyrinogen-3 oxidase
MNPGYVTEANVRDFKAIGINRVSIGVQSLTSEGLRVLGRKHTVENALLTIKACAALFSNYSIDLIYAWPNHTLESWKKELVDVFALNLSHISFYQLVIEDDSTFGHMYSRGELLLPDDDTCANMFEYLQEATDKAGIPAYEISNHAVPGFECRHNISYWKYLDYVGIGPGAHSRITLGQQKYATVHESNPKKWLNSIMDNQHILEDMVPLSQDEQAKEAILVGLRMVEGIDIRKLPLPLNQIINLEAYERLIKENYLVVDGDILTATYKGRKRLNALIAYLIR